MLRLLFNFIIIFLRNVEMHLTEVLFIKVRPKPSIFRADARAGDASVGIGGWRCDMAPNEAKWLSVQLDRNTVPWMYTAEEPFRKIVSLEIQASLIPIEVLIEKTESGQGATFSLSGESDNLGNVFLESKLLPTTLPY